MKLTTSGVMGWMQLGDESCPGLWQHYQRQGTGCKAGHSLCTSVLRPGPQHEGCLKRRSRVSIHPEKLVRSAVQLR
eukprot:2376830-Amphidinium_carterae.1